MQDGVPDMFRQVAPGGFGGLFVVPSEALQGLVVVGGLGAGPGDDGALGQSGAVVRDDEVGVEEAFHAEAVADRTGAVRGVEAEQPWFDFLDAEAADGAGEFGGEDGAVGAVGVLGVDDAVGHGEGGFEAVG
jgi:hypothetical protein